MRDDVSSITPTPPSTLAAVERAIDGARRTLRELWWHASTADRIFAVDRLLREDLLAPDVHVALQRAADVVRDAWVTARVAKTLEENVPADAQLASLQLSLAERDRDNLLERQHGFDALFCAAEGYLRSVPLVAGGSFRDLMNERERLRAKLVPILPPLDDGGPST